MNARELLQEWKERCNRLPRTAEEEDYQTILRALSLLAAAEANDGTTPETDAVRDFTWRCEHHPEHQGGMVTTRMIEARLFEEADELRGFARRLELERNGLARELSDALEETARLKAMVAGIEAGAHDMVSLERKRAERAEAELAKLRQHAEAMAEHWENDDTMDLMASAVTAYRRDFPKEEK